MIHRPFKLSNSRSRCFYTHIEFRKRLTDDIFGRINEMIIEFNTQDDPTPSGGASSDKHNSETSEHIRIMILDTTHRACTAITL